MDVFLTIVIVSGITKMTKMELNYNANLNINVSGIVCQLIHQFPGKQGLAINLPWLILKHKQTMHVEFVDTL